MSEKKALVGALWAIGGFPVAAPGHSSPVRATPVDRPLWLLRDRRSGLAELHFLDLSSEVRDFAQGIAVFGSNG